MAALGCCVAESCCWLAAERRKGCPQLTAPADRDIALLNSSTCAAEAGDGVWERCDLCHSGGQCLCFLLTLSLGATGHHPPPLNEFN